MKIEYKVVETKVEGDWGHQLIEMPYGVFRSIRSALDDGSENKIAGYRWPAVVGGTVVCNAKIPYGFSWEHFAFVDPNNPEGDLIPIQCVPESEVVRMVLTISKVLGSGYHTDQATGRVLNANNNANLPQVEECVTEYQKGDWMVVDHARKDNFATYLVSYDFAKYFQETLDCFPLMEELSLDDKAIDLWSYAPLYDPLREYSDLEELPSSEEPVFLTIYYEDLDVLIERGDYTGGE